MKDRSRLCNLIKDSYRFVHQFTPLMEQHPLLIYKSALPFTPPGTEMYTTFHKMQGIPRIAGNLPKFWSARLMVLSVHGQTVHSVAMTPNGTRIIAGLGDCTIGIWDAVSGVKIKDRLRGHSGPVRSVACSHDGAHVISGSDDCTVRLWDMESAEEVLVLQGHEDRVNCVCFSPVYSSNNMRVLSGSRDRTVRLWDATADTHVVGLCTDWINAVTFSPDGQLFVTGARNGFVRVRDTASGAMIALLLNTQTSIRSVAFSPDGQWIASGSTDGIIRIWNIKDSTRAPMCLKGHEHTRTIRSLAFFPNTKQIISGAKNGTLRVWNFESGEEVRVLREHGRSVESIVVSKDGERIITGSEDRSIRVWAACHFTGASDKENSLGIVITASALSYDGGCFATASLDKNIHLWDTDKGAERSYQLKGHTDLIRSLSFSPDGRKIASGADGKDGNILVWDTAKGEILLQLQTRRMGRTSSIAFSSDSCQIVSGSAEGMVRIWELHSRKLSQSLHHKDVTCIAFSPDGMQIVSGSKDSTVRIWHTKSGQEISQLSSGHGHFIRSVAFSPDAQYILSKSSSQSSSYKSVYKWSQDDTRGVSLSMTKCLSHRTSHVLDPFALTLDGWIIDTSSEKLITKLPPNISIDTVTASAASNTVLVIATDRGSVIVIHFNKRVPSDIADSTSVGVATTD